MSRSTGRSPSDSGEKRNPLSASEQTRSGAAPVSMVGDWGILVHPLLLDQIERVLTAAAKEKAKQGSGDAEGPNMKLAAAMWRIMLEEVPEDPSRPRYRHGGTLGEHLKHWLRAKFGNGRFRLFFRYRRDARLIVYAWVNDAATLRTYGSQTDAYAVFQRMLRTGNPPDEWDALVHAASNPDAIRRAHDLLKEPQDLRGGMRGMSTDLEREDDRL